MNVGFTGVTTTSVREATSRPTTALMVAPEVAGVASGVVRIETKGPETTKRPAGQTRGPTVKVPAAVPVTAVSTRTTSTARKQRERRKRRE